MLAYVGCRMKRFEDLPACGCKDDLMDNGPEIEIKESSLNSNLVCV